MMVAYVWDVAGEAPGYDFLFRGIICEHLQRPLKIFAAKSCLFLLVWLRLL